MDYIVFSDTLMELPLMYEYIEKVKKYFKERYNKEIIVTKPNKTFDEVIFGTIKQKDAKRVGWIKGIPSPMHGFCEWRRDSKVVPFGKLLKTLVDDEYTTYIGYTTDERHRKINDDGNYIYPLRDYFDMSERNCQEYLINQEMENPLYKYFTRTGCGICPAQSDKAWYEVYKNFSDTWEYMKFVEKRFDYYKSLGYKIINEFWFSGERNTEDMEKIFKAKDQQGSLFDFSDEPLKDCFCKI